jgi:hypothetical protein
MISYHHPSAKNKSCPRAKCWEIGGGGGEAHPPTLHGPVFSPAAPLLPPCTLSLISNLPSPLPPPPTAPLRFPPASATPPTLNMQHLENEFDLDQPLGPLSPSLLTICHGLGDLGLLRPEFSLDSHGGPPGPWGPSDGSPLPDLRQCETPDMPDLTLEGDSHLDTMAELPQALGAGENEGGEAAAVAAAQHLHKHQLRTATAPY